MKIYAVGGAIRDELLKLPVADHDWVVVGATPEEMVAEGFKPIGRDFPVFLHPQTHEEYALARTERKIGPGYKGFTFHTSPDVTLEQDLRRRDLTINAMARDPQGTLIDPFGGVNDLQHRLLRHVSEAFVEDPVRILRVARFAARFKKAFNFSVAPETLALMQTMVVRGEADTLVPERVWQELARGLAEPTPSELFRVLDQCHALPRILPELAPFWASHAATSLASVDHAARCSQGLGVRFAAWITTLLQEAPNGGRDVILQFTERLRVPAEIRDLARITSENCHAISQSAAASADTVLRLIERTDGLRRPQRFEAMLAAHASTEPVNEHAIRDRLTQALQAASQVLAGEIARQENTPERIRERIRSARLEAIATVLQQHSS
ncbi:MAG: multifunctional CCA tRNA nucleotidyl transferase/2'3'-cyclic phosphodiesterase/2'nucleotidase/phosphatase [Betaproteobacteria bacterium]|nr:multifunctional CCA tRNA nucleotidyl transferase/2'3'-cyclic phosphodiesterase/2'nucleotidase/phosphatase [Betaproteobacteria bacterium]